MQKAGNIIKEVATFTDRVILFHSGTGKDSIALLNMVRPHFKEVACVFMYVVKDLQHVNKYIRWAEKTYDVKFLHLPHYVLGSYIKHGIMGMKKDPTQKIYTLADIDERARLKTGIGWSIYGFKQVDSLNRRLMLRTYDKNAINHKTGKAYPLSEYKNGDVLKYIKRNRLLNPLNYGGKHQSSGQDIHDMNFILYCKHKYPQDYKKIIKSFPEVEIRVFQHESKGKY